MGNYVFTANIHEEYSELIKRVKSGDESAFSEIYEKSERYVYTTCFEILGNKEDAEDAMQETYMALYKGIEGINEGKAFIDWIHTTAYFKATNIRSRKRPDLAYEDALANEEISEMADDDLESLPESLITDKTNRDIIKKIMHDKLSAVQYDTVLLHYYNEMPVAKIAEIMDCPEGTIKTRLKACRAKLKSGIESYEKLHGGEKLVGAAGVPFLTRFFVECSKELTLPVINMFPAPVTSTGSVSSAAETGAKAGQLAQSGTETAEAASNAAKTGRLGQESAKAGQFAKNAGSTANMGSKGGLFASPLAKIGIAVAAVAVVAVPTVIIVTNMNKDKKDDDKVYEIQYDGLYCNIDKDEGTNDIIRFYPDGDLIYTSYDFDDEDECFPTGSWFNLDSDDDRVENGTYEVDEGKIAITIEHGSKDKIYKGEINKNDIVLGKDDKYKFYEFDDIDGYEPEIGNTTESTAETEPVETTETTENPLESKVKGAYLKVVVMYENELKEHENYPQDEIPHQDPIPSINYCDLNKDGISEMVLVTYNTSMNRSEIDIYTYDEARDEAIMLAYYKYFTNVGNTDGPDVWNEMVYLDNDHILMMSHCYFGYASSYYEQMDNNYYIDTSENFDSYWKAEWNGSAFDDVVYCDYINPDYASRTEAAYYDAINNYAAHAIAPVYPGEARFLSRDFSFDMDSIFGRYGTYKPTDSFSVFDSVYAQGHYYLYDDFVAFLGG